MKPRYVWKLFIAIFLVMAVTLGGGASLPDPFLMGENYREDGWNNNRGYSDVNSKTLRITPINAQERTLVLITSGQSNMASVGPSSYVPTNASKVDNLSIYDGAIYATADPLIGQTYAPDYGVGSIPPRIADKLITGVKFDRVILVPVASGGSSIAMWAPGGPLYMRHCVAMHRLAARGIVPGMPGVTFALVWGQGESDAGTAQATYQTRFGQIVTKLKNCPNLASQFNGRIFITKQTMLSNVVNATTQAAQVALIDNVSIFSGGDIDALTGGTNRIADGTHLTATGQANAATAIYNAMVASGAPF